MSVLGTTLFFYANDGMSGFELWKSDGTEAGTVLVKDINGGGDSYPGNFTVLGTTMYFVANDGVGSELWKSDGTAAGTVLAKDSSGSPVLVPGYLTVMGSTLFFSATEFDHGRELWWTVEQGVLTFSAGEHGAISGTSPQNVNMGANGTAVTAVPDTGYHFVNWSDGRAANPRTEMSVAADITVTANFAINTYTLTVVSPHGTASPMVGGHSYESSTALTPVVANPAPAGSTRYVCTGWSMTGSEPTSGTTASCVMTVTNDAVLTWLWTTNYYLTTAAVPSGSLTVDSGWQPLGVTTQLTAVAASYYHFTAWSGDAGGSSNILELLMDAPKSVTANFAANVTTTHPTPEAWLAQYGITSDFDPRSLDDADHDGLANWQEYVAGTDPTNAASRLVITAIGPALGTNYAETVVFYPATNVVVNGVTNSWDDHWATQRVYEAVGHSVTWPGVTGRVYNLEYSTNLLNWFDLEGATDLPGHSPDNTFTDMPPSNVKFYRVKVRLP